MSSNSLEIFKIGFFSIGVWDIIDILLVTFIIYKLYFMLRRTHAVQMFIGLLLIFVVSFISQALGLQELSWIFTNLRTVWLIAFVILFQPELRRVLRIMGQSRLVSVFSKEQTNLVVEEIANSVIEISQRGYGALIVISRKLGLKPIIETGVEIQSTVTSSLLVSIFNPRSPLHDGAVIINNDIIAAAKCILPLSRDPDLEHRWGTRHRAAIGMSEKSDALVVVVSEETSKISIVENGEMMVDIAYKDLLNTLKNILHHGMKKS